MMNKKAFTIVETMIVIIIIGVLATVAIPRITGTINQSTARDAMNNLRIIHASAELFRVRNNNTVYSTDRASLADINTDLGLNLIASTGTTYSCNHPGSAPVSAAGTCVAINADRNFTVTLTLVSALAAGNPSCAGTGCPTY